MAKKNKGKELLENAYKLKTPADNISYYDEFAATYDSDFAQDMGWNYPRAIADIYSDIAAAEDLPIADIGCGTGLIAVELKMSREFIDGFDISPEMLQLAEDKSIYRELYIADLIGSLDALPNDYGAVVSAGTFTHGHLGPEALMNILTMGRAGSLYVIGINQVHFDTFKFGDLIEELISDSKISHMELREIPMYSKTDHEHGADVALALIFRKSG